MLIVMTTTPDVEEAESVAKKLVNARLAACVQILPPMVSFYAWEDSVQRAHEHLLLIKTLDDRFEPVRDFILGNHSYEMPEVVAVTADNVSEGYLAWMTEYLNQGGVG